jgi:5-methylcytosine-specific restriction endonuclease McrA
MAKFSRKSVAARADGLCEYCQLPETESVLPHTIDHIRARKHRGPTTIQNTCWACAQCNGAKGSDATSYDPETDELVRLFNPRADEWKDHFLWHGPTLRGKTPVGRATIALLRINDVARIEQRRLLMAAGAYPMT